MQFARLRQLSGQSITSFSSHLHTADAKCQLDKPSEHIRDHLIAHMQALEGSKKLQKEDVTKPTLAIVLKDENSAKALDAQFAAQRPLEAATASYKPSCLGSSNRGYHKSHNVPSTPSSRSSSSGTSQSRANFACGTEPVHQHRECPT